VIDDKMNDVLLVLNFTTVALVWEVGVLVVKGIGNTNWSYWEIGTCHADIVDAM
jgi:hypothetical protein